MGTSLAVKLTPTTNATPCERCGGGQDVVKIDIIQGWETADRPGIQQSVHMCADCLADGVERATGFRATRQLANWRNMRALGKGARQTA